LYCGACSILRAYQDGPAQQSKIAAEFGCLPEQVRCEGCGALTTECWGNGCGIVMCLREHGLASCHECPSFQDESCQRHADLARRYAKRGVDVRANLHAIQAGREEEWLAAQEARWRCPVCGRAVSAWWDACRWCGASQSTGAPKP